MPSGVTPLPPADELRQMREEHPNDTLAQHATRYGVSTERLGRQMRRLCIVQLRVSQEDVHAAVLRTRTGPFSTLGATLTQGLLRADGVDAMRYQVMLVLNPSTPGDVGEGGRSGFTGERTTSTVHAACTTPTGMKNWCSLASGSTG